MSSIYVRKPKRDTHTESVYSKLRRLAYERGPNGKLPTTRELCVTLQASRMTLDGALNALESENIVLRKHGSGIYVSPRINHKSIAIVLPHRPNVEFISAPFWGMMQEILVSSALARTPVRKHDYSLHLLPFGFSREESESRRNFEDLLLSGTLDAVLSARSDNALQELMIRSGIPVVGYALGPGCGWAVGYDYFQIFRLAAEQLIHHGCRRVMHVVTHEDLLDSDYSSRIAELYRSMNVPVTFSEDRSGSESRGLSHDFQASGWHLMRDILRTPGASQPDGLIFGNDMVADGAIKALCDMGIRPGQDLLIATHANAGSPILHQWESKLILIETDPAMLVAKMFEILDDILDARPPASEFTCLPWCVRAHGVVVGT